MFLLEDTHYTITYYKIVINTNNITFNDNDFITIYRSEHYNELLHSRDQSLTITNNSIIITNYKKQHKITKHNIDLCNINKIILQVNKCDDVVLLINNEKIVLENFLCFGKTVIDSSFDCINKNDCSIEYLNYKRNIPHVYGDCMANIHTHKHFGKYFYEKNSNYYVCQKPSIDYIDMLNTLERGLINLNPELCLITIKANVSKHTYEFIESLIKKYTDTKFILFTIPKIKYENRVIIYNELLRSAKYKFNNVEIIDLATYFNNLHNKEIYFNDNAHTNEEGAKLVYEILKEKIPELTITYDI